MVEGVRESVQGRHRGVAERRQPRSGEGHWASKGGGHRPGRGRGEVCRGSGDLGRRPRRGEGHARHDHSAALLALSGIRGAGVLDVDPSVGLEVDLMCPGESYTFCNFGVSGFWAA